MTTASEAQTHTQTSAAKANSPNSSASVMLDKAVATDAQTSAVCGSSYSDAAENVCTNPTCPHRGVEVTYYIAASVSYGISVLNGCLLLPPNTYRYTYKP